MVHVHAVDAGRRGSSERIVVTGRLVAAISVDQIELHGIRIGRIPIVEPTSGHAHVGSFRMPASVGRVDQKSDLEERKRGKMRFMIRILHNDFHLSPLQKKKARVGRGEVGHLG